MVQSIVKKHGAIKLRVLPYRFTFAYLISYFCRKIQLVSIRDGVLLSLISNR